jgi:hypothetical protein
MKGNRLLAEEFIAKPLYRLSKRLIDSTTLIPGVKRATKFVLDDDATRLVADLSNQAPKDIAAMLTAAWPASQETWIELPCETLIQAREKFHGQGWRDAIGAKPRPSHHRLAIYVHPSSMSADAMVINCVEHDDEDIGVMAWPAGFVFYKEPQRISLAAEEDWGRKLWAYGPSIDIRPLYGRAALSVHPAFNAEREMKFLDGAVHELRGFLRLAIAALAAINTIAEISPPTKGEGRFIGRGGTTHARQAAAFVTLRLPHRVKDVKAYARRQFVAYHKRLHEVRPHYRHLKHNPLSEGWEAIETHLGPRWRKVIQGHLRGNPDLGVVEHKGIRVTTSPGIRGSIYHANSGRRRPAI